MARRDHKKGSIPFQFVPVPKDVIRSQEWQALPPNAVKLAIDLMGQYTGKNNGRLCPAITVMDKCGWKSNNTLLKAKKALLECPFVFQTRKGHAPRTTDWLGFTWWQLDFEASMDIDPKKVPYLNFGEVKRIDPNEGREQATGKLSSVVQKLHRYSGKRPLGSAETAPMEAAAR